MIKRIALLAMAAGATLALTACGHEAPKTTPGATAVAAPASVPPTAAPTPSAPVSGYITKKVGERAGITNTDGSAAVDFWITRITVDPKCDAYMSRSAGNHTILLDVTVQTHTDKDADQGSSAFGILPGLINPYALSTTGNDGVTNQAETDMCLLSTKQLPSAYGPNRTYTGQIAIATTDKTGALQLTDGSGLLGQGAHGWEWKY
jgi:hypothetical protein